MSYEDSFRYYGWGNYTPEIETFIKYWQKADSAEGAKELLETTLSELKGREETVASASALLQRARSWRDRGVPLKNLPLSPNAPETEEEKILRLTKLALQYTEEN
jgi:hypothetical protein